MRFSCKSCGATFQTASGTGPKAAFACPACGGEMAASAEVVELHSDRVPTRRYDMQDLRARLEAEREESARARGTPRTAEQVWFAAVQGRQVGPLTSAGLQGLRARGQLSAATLVWREGWPAWVSAEAVGELRPVLGLPEEKPGQPFPVQPVAPAPPPLGATYPAARSAEQGEVAALPAALPLAPEAAPAVAAAPAADPVPAQPAEHAPPAAPADRTAPPSVTLEAGPQLAPAQVSLPFFVADEPRAAQTASLAAPETSALAASAAAPGERTSPGHPAPVTADPADAPAPAFDAGAVDTTDPGGPPPGMIVRGPGRRALPSIPPEPRAWGEGEKTVPDAPLPDFGRGEVTVPDAALPVFEEPPPLPGEPASGLRPPALPEAAQDVAALSAALASAAPAFAPGAPPPAAVRTPQPAVQAAPAPAPPASPADPAASTAGDAPPPSEPPLAGTEQGREPSSQRRRARGKPRSNPQPRSGGAVKTLDLSTPRAGGERPSRPPPQDEWFAPVADGKEVNKAPVALAVAIVVVLLALAMLLRSH